jgi:pimeloyl-[acyl-carrier protein] methyl ester esterase
MSQIYQRTIGQGQPIVLVHGWGMHSGVWGDFAEQLAQHYQVICVDLPGHGKSGAIDKFNLVTVAAALVQAISVKNACWLGWSLGATIVLEVAKCYPDKVSHLVLLAGNPCFIQQIGDKGEQWPGMPVGQFDLFSQRLQKDEKATLLQFLSLQVYGLKDMKNYLNSLRQKMANHLLPCRDILHSALAVLKHSDLRPHLATITQPMLWLLGEQDSLVPAQLGLYLDKYPTIQVHIVKDAGHIVFLSHTSLTVAAVIAFLGQI